MPRSIRFCADEPRRRRTGAPRLIELLILRTGGFELAPATFLAGASDAKTYVPVWSALVRTDEGNIVFDTGLHPVHVERPYATFGPGGLKAVMAAEDGIVRRLAAVGVRPEDVNVVVNSHLHFDHAGNNGAFPRATFVVQGEHLDFAKGKTTFPGVYWDLPELSYLRISGRARVSQGVEVVPTPGHAPGHQSLLVELAETGRVVLCGDAAYTRENLERGEIRQPHDEAQGRGSLALIRSLVDDDLERAFVSHDAGAFARWRVAPLAYR